MSRRTDPLDPRVLNAPVYTVGFLPRLRWLLASTAGAADGRRGVLASAFGAAGQQRDGEITTHWIGKERAAARQAQDREYVRMATAIAAEASELRDIRVRAAHHMRELDRLTAELAMLRERPTPTQVRRGPAEQFATDEVVLARRTKAHLAPQQACEARIAELRGRLQADRDRGAHLEGVLEIAFDVLTARCAGIRDFHERPAETYRRRLTHTHRGGADIQAATMGTITIPAPAWATGPNPWIAVEPTVTEAEGADRA